MSEDRIRDRSPIDRKDGGGGGGRRGGDRGRRSGFGSAGKGRRAPPERRIFVSNIPFEMKWQEVKDMFRDEVGDVTYVELFNDENDKPRGCGILELGSAELAKQAVEKMHRKELKGRKLVVKEDFDTDRDKFGRIISGGGGGGRRGGGGDRDRDRDRGGSMSGGGGGGGIGGGGLYGSNTYGLSPQFLESLGIDGPLHNRLFIANLAYSVDEKKLREVFRLAGRVVTAELNRDKDGKSRGHAVIEYDHPVEAVQAISMLNNQVLCDRKITVRFDKQPGPTPEELSQLPSRLPEGLNGVGMGLGSGGNPLTEVAKNLPSAQNSQNTPQNQIQAPAQVAPQQQPQQMNPMGGGGGGGMGDAAGAPNLLGGLNELSALSVLTRQLAGGGGQNLLSALSSLGNAAGNSNNAGGMGGMPNMGGNNMGGGTGNMGGGGGGGNMGMGGMNSAAMGANRGPSSAGGMGNMGGMGMVGGSAGGQGGMGDGRGSTGYSTAGTAGYGGDINDLMGGRTNGGQIGSSGMGGGVGSSVRQSDTVTVRNLPPDCNWQILREGFAHCGDIKYAEMKDRGTGMIRFINERDAERAVSMMNNQTIAGRTIEVRLY